MKGKSTQTCGNWWSQEGTTNMPLQKGREQKEMQGRNKNAGTQIDEWRGKSTAFIENPQSVMSEITAPDSV